MHPGWADTPGVGHSMPLFKKLLISDFVLQKKVLIQSYGLQRLLSIQTENFGLTGNKRIQRFLI